MTVEEVEGRVEVVRAVAGDPEAAHGAEDALRAAVLEAIAAGAENAQQLAVAALKTGDIRFDRWCA